MPVHIYFYLYLSTYVYIYIYIGTCLHLCLPIDLYIPKDTSCPSAATTYAHKCKTKIKTRKTCLTTRMLDSCNLQEKTTKTWPREQNQHNLPLWIVTAAARFCGRVQFLARGAAKKLVIKNVILFSYYVGKMWFECDWCLLRSDRPGHRKNGTKTCPGRRRDFIEKHAFLVHFWDFVRRPCPSWENKFGGLAAL